MCKKRLKAYISIENTRLPLEAYYHPEGCMKAKQPHLDLPCIEPLCSLTVKRGFTLMCRNLGNCIELTEPITGITVTICLEAGEPLCRKSVYIMRTRSKKIYISPIIVRTEH
ncbi:hypothetical protein Pyrde_2038 [Pyrodictium delaneyi]|uniref:Uncharacterized protein n=1 Tax=Pyrodictium delaneyi TaxID=1273541 RepID=A0A0N7JDF9_9CREN|nr:hypothetical protein [Pyrodictium delaneyi]ALL02081.1 hypothetical protein Pyrde_2038 [Pyrodictium delaneyi]OWJ54765.1 hypothetical protein Pdsh_03310 [Pyrodictium delaneyi]